MAGKVNTARRRKFFSVARLLHIYISTLLFGLLVFFCITGITLNHRWYGQNSGPHLSEVPLTETQMVEWGFVSSSDGQVDLNAVIRYFRQAHQLPEVYSAEFDEGLGEIILEYKVPAGFATAIVSSEEKIIFLEIEQGSLLGVLNDLHKGRHSGTFWFWLIDISALLMVLFSLTGMVIIFQGKKNRRAAIVLCAAGIVSPALFYWLFVPKVGI